MYPKSLLLFAFIFVLHATCFGQLYPTQYRPPGQDWQQLNISHLNVIYAPENSPQAIELAQILESQYPQVQKLVGGELRHFPIILNNYNDRSNGFVTSFNFRSEIELPPIKGKSLNPQTGNWLTSVGPHELVHALQFSNLGDYNIPRLVNLFSPDLARSFHGALPPGVAEGIAVYHETTNITEHGGRGNYPIFTKQFDATFDSNRRWSMGQLLQVPDYTRPFGRHYMGGYEFTNWLHNTFGDNITRNALDFYMDFPFLGYGVALRHATGSWPGQLYKQFEAYHKNRLDKEDHSPGYTELEVPYKGREIRRPKWLSNSKLIFYGSFYNARPGFYSYDLTTQTLSRLLTTNSVRDFRYSLSDDRSQLVFSYYKTDPIYDNTAKAQLVSYHFESQKQKSLATKERLYAPAFYGDELLALESHPGRSKLVALSNTNNGDGREVFSAPNHEIKAVAVHPDGKQLAIISNKNGRQALWITARNDVAEQLKGTADIAFAGGAIFDPEWHPNGRKVLFSSDFSGTMQLYEYDLPSKRIVQLTDSNFNAFEGSYSPDGSRIAFIKQDKNERLLALIKRTEFLNRPVAKPRGNKVSSQNSEAVTVISDSVANASQSWETDTYTSGLGWLKPRTVLPSITEVSNQGEYEAGLSLHSVNTLSTQAYSADVTYFKERGWYDVSYQNKTFWPGFRTRLYSTPSYRFPGNLGAIGRQERALALSIPFRVDLNRNIYRSSFVVEPEIRRSQIRFFDADFNDPVSDFSDITAGNIYAQFNYRLQQNIRDLQPNTGIILFAEFEHYFSGDEISISDNISFSAPASSALQGGIYGYIAPLKRWNQSLRLGVRGISQSNVIFDNQSVVSNAFTEPVFGSANNLLSINTRYTIPLTYVDNGGLLLPVYLGNLYLVAFTDSVFDLTLEEWHNRGRSVFGLGLRTKFRLGNLRFDLGVGFGFEPRGEYQFFIGDF